MTDWIHAPHDESCCSEHGMHPAPKAVPPMPRFARVALGVLVALFVCMSVYTVLRGLRVIS